MDPWVKTVQDHREAWHEPDALRAWDGNGAVKLLAQEGDVMVIERCVPGTPISAAGQDVALDFFVEVLPRLWVEAGEPFHTLADESAWWYPKLPEGRLGDAARAAIDELAHTQGEQVLLHQDLHGDNVLAAEREPWLVIDPKPLVGEREFAVAPIVRSRELGDTKRDALYRFDRLTAELGLDRERARGWTVAQSVAWASDATHPFEVEWLL